MDSRPTPRDVYWYRRRRLVRVVFWTLVAVTLYALMDYLTPEFCENAATFTEACI